MRVVYAPYYGSILVEEDIKAATCQEVAVYRGQVSGVETYHQTHGRISLEEEEVRKLDKVEQWQRGRAVLGKNNLLRHSCHPDAPRRRGIFDFYNQQYSLVAEIEEVVILSDPPGCQPGGPDKITTS